MFGQFFQYAMMYNGKKVKAPKPLEEIDDFEMKHVAVVGAGAFGTSMATICARAGHPTILYARKENVIASINENHINPEYLSKYTLPDLLTATSDLDVALEACDLLILALPAQIIPQWLHDNLNRIKPDLLICNTAKGLFLKDKILLSEAIQRALGRDQPYAVLSGPSFAAEIMDNMPTAGSTLHTPSSSLIYFDTSLTLVVIASKFLYHAVAIQRIMSSLMFRCYASQDVIGVELGGSLKNPLAIGAGIIEGLGLGINTMAAYVTNSSIELQSLCKAMGGDPQTISGLAGGMVIIYELLRPL